MSFNRHIASMMAHAVTPKGKGAFHCMINVRSLFLLSLTLLTTSTAFSQAVNGTIVGTVTDISGGVVAGARVTLTEVNTQIVHTGQTNASGSYSFPELPPGTYDIAAEMAGFKKGVRTGVVLEANNSPRAGFKTANRRYRPERWSIR